MALGQKIRGYIREAGMKQIVIAGTHIAPDEAKATLYEAYQLHLDDIEAANEEE